MRKLLFFIVIIIAANTCYAQKTTYSFSPENTSRVINFLAADEMKGRSVFSPEIDKAATFIADEFKKAGLQPLQGNSFLQPFTILSASLVNLSASVNNMPLNKDNVIVITDQPEIAITEKSGYTISKIAATDNLFATARRVISSGKNSIVLVDTSFTNNFKRLVFFKRNFFKTGGTAVFLLGNYPLDQFAVSATHTIKENKLANVAGVLPGTSKKDEYVIFSAHYDHIGIGKPENGDSIFNGANDDASGTTAVVMLADYFKKIGQHERSIIFVAFTAEESGGFGSQYFSRQIPPEKVVAMCNIEMIGTDSKWGKNSAYITGFDKSDLGVILQKNLSNTGFTFYPDPYPQEQLFYRSDNATLARLGVPAHTISTSKMDNEPNYHKPSDEVKTLDINNMTAIIKAIGVSAGSIISGKDTPARVTGVEN